MQVTAGTTSARIHVIGRWAFAGSVLVGAGMGFAGYRPWACLTVFWLLVWAVWMFSALIRGQRHVPGNLVHVSLLSVALLLACHLASYMVNRNQRPVSTMDGQLDASMLFHAVLLALGVFLAQSYLGDGDHRRMLRFCGAAIVIGSAAALFMPLSPGAGDAHAITLLSGFFIFTAPRWTNRPRRLFWSSTARASIFLLMGVSVLVMFGLTILWWNVAGSLLWQTPWGWIGRGELAFSVVSGASSGSAVLGGTTGYLGWLVFVVGLLAALARVVVRGQWNRTAFFWVAATALSTLAILAPGGYFLPITAVTFALTWGLLPRICGAPTARASGLLVVGVMLLLAMLLGLTRKVGLLVTISRVYELSDKQSHGIFGFLLAIVLAWWFGAKHAWLGAVGLVAAALIGGLGEVAQRVIGLGRASEWADWRAHAIGAGLAAVLVTLCFIARGGAPAKRGQSVVGYKKIPAQWLGGLLMVVVLMTAVGWMGLSVWRTTESWRRKRPWFVVSDGVEAAGRNTYYLRGVIEPPPPTGEDLLMTVSANGIQDAYESRENIYAKLMGKGTGLHRQSILGQPFGELSTHRHQKGRFLLIDKGAKLFAVDAAMVISRRGRQTVGLDAALAELKKEGTIVLFDTGQPLDYWRLRPILQVRYPDTPCVAVMPAPKNSTEVLAQIRRKTGSKIVVFTADVNLARAAKRRLGGGVDVHLIDSERTPGPLDKGLTVHPSLNAFLHPRPTTLPATK